MTGWKWMREGWSMTHLFFSGNIVRRDARNHRQYLPIYVKLCSSGVAWWWHDIEALSTLLFVAEGMIPLARVSNAKLVCLKFWILARTSCWAENSSVRRRYKQHGTHATQWQCYMWIGRINQLAERNLYKLKILLCKSILHGPSVSGSLHSPTRGVGGGLAKLGFLLLQQSC